MRYLTVLFLFACSLFSLEERLDLDVISYASFIDEEPQAIKILERALREKGIVGIRGVPGFKEKALQFVQAAREFSSLPEEIKERYAPNRDKGELFLGYEKGKERFKRPDGHWVVDDLKVSYYAFVPDVCPNKWPQEVDLKTPFQSMGLLMDSIAEKVMKTVGLLGSKTGIYLDGVPRVGRMLYYRKSEASTLENPDWCGAHFDHGLFTALLPAFYFVNGEQVSEPVEAGLYVKAATSDSFKKVAADDPDVLLFQVGEFAQLATNDNLLATEHKVVKASGLQSVERYTMALFYSAAADTALQSTSVLSADSRYGEEPTCSYKRWEEASFNRYIVK